MGNGVRKLAAVAAALISACVLSGCATAHLHAVNRAATLNTQALAGVGPIYDSAAAARIDSTTLGYTDRRTTVIPADELRDDNARDLAYRAKLLALRRHADMLREYFTELAAYTAPGTSSATTLTDAQLANAGGIASVLKTIEPDLTDAAANALVQIGVNVVADQALNAHLTDHGQEIADGLLIQIGALKVVRRNLAYDREQSCQRARHLFEVARSHPPQTAMTADQQTAFATRRRELLTCNNDAADADAAIAALTGSRLAFINLLETEQPPGREAALAGQADPLAVRLAPVIGLSHPDSASNGAHQ